MALLIGRLFSPGHPEVPSRLTAGEWDAIIAGLIREREYLELFRTLFNAPLINAREITWLLKKSGWIPTNPADRDLLRDLISCCTGPAWLPEPPGPSRDLTSPASQVNRVAITEEGILVTSSYTGTLRWWQLPFGEYLAEDTGHQSPVVTIYTTANAASTVSAGYDGNLHFHDGRGSLIRTLSGEGTPVTACAVSREGSRIATAASQGEITVWNIPSGTRRTITAPLSSPVIRLAFSLTGEYLAAGSEDGTIRVLKEGTDDQCILIPGEGHAVRFLGFVQTGQNICLISSSGGRGIPLRLLPEGSISGVAVLPGNVRCIAVSPRGDLLAAAGKDKIIHLFAIPGGNSRGTLSAFRGSFTTLEFTKDGNTLVSGNSDGSVHSWDMRDLTLIAETRAHKKAVRQIAVWEAGNAIVSVGDDDLVRVLRLPLLTPLNTLRNHAAGITSLALVRDDTLVLTGDCDGRVRAWNLPTGHPDTGFDAYTTGIVALAATPDGSYVAASGKDRSLRIWDRATGDILRDFSQAENTSWAVAISPGGKLLASGGWDEVIRIHDIADGSLKATLTGHTSVVTALAFFPDGACLASGSNDCTIRIWDTRTGKHIRTIGDTKKQVNCITLNSEGNLLAAGSKDGILRIYRLPDAEVLAVIKGHSDAVQCLSIHPSSAVLASGSRDGSLCLWNIPDGRPVHPIKGFSGPVTCCAFSRDGTFLVVGSSDGTLSTLPVPWLRTLGEATPDDLISVQRTIREFGNRCAVPEPWLFLETALRGKFRYEIGIGDYIPGPSEFDIEIVE
ncbi:MAG: WD40 repeat domain-containing protein [Methanoregulaceae archaeon]